MTHNTKLTDEERRRRLLRAHGVKDSEMGFYQFDEANEAEAEAEAGGGDEEPEEVNPRMNRHDPMTTKGHGHRHGRYALHTHEADADHSNAPLRADGDDAVGDDEQEDDGAGDLQLTDGQLQERAEALAIEEHEGKQFAELPYDQQMALYDEAAGGGRGVALSGSGSPDAGSRGPVGSTGAAPGQDQLSRASRPSAAQRAAQDRVSQAVEQGARDREQREKAIAQAQQAEAVATARASDDTAVQQRAEQLARSVHGKPFNTCDYPQQMALYDMAAKQLAAESKQGGQG